MYVRFLCLHVYVNKYMNIQMYINPHTKLNNVSFKNCTQIAAKLLISVAIFMRFYSLCAFLYKYTYVHYTYIHIYTCKHTHIIKYFIALLCFAHLKVIINIILNCTYEYTNVHTYVCKFVCLHICKLIFQLQSALLLFHFCFLPFNHAIIRLSQTTITGRLIAGNTKKIIACDFTTQYLCLAFVIVFIF